MTRISLKKKLVPRAIIPFLFVMMVGLILQPGCATDQSGGNTNSDDPRDVSEDVEEDLVPRLKQTFQQMKTALNEGDLKTLQKIWISPGGEKYSIEMLSEFYERKGQKVEQAIREASINESLGADVSVPSSAIQKRHPNASHAGTLPVRNSYGHPRALRAVLIDDSWRFIYQINLKSPENSSDESDDS